MNLGGIVARAILNPMSFSKNPLLDRLHSARGLSNSQRRIADCLIANMNEAALWGVVLFQ